MTRREYVWGQDYGGEGYRSGVRRTDDRGIAVPAYAADLGGDCCADLEERVAELEATSARKGNRVDVGGTSPAASTRLCSGGTTASTRTSWSSDNSAKGSRFQLKGSGKLSDGLKAGFVLQIKTRPNRSKRVDDWAVKKADDDYAGNDELAVGDVYWNVDSEQLGKLTMGFAAHAANGTAEVDISSGINGISNLSAINENITFNGSTKVVGVFGPYINSDVGNLVKWDSPTFGGFQVSASWGDDDRWSAAARYASEFNGVKIAAAVGYDVKDGEAEAVSGPKVELIASASILHSASGLFASGAYGAREDDIEESRHRLVGEGWLQEAGQRTRCHQHLCRVR